MTTKFLIPLIAGCGLCLARMGAATQDYKIHITKQFSPQKTAANTMVGIYNIFGPVRVEGYSGNKVLIEIDETISGKSSADIEQGKKEFQLQFEQNADTIMAYIAQPWYTKPSEKGLHYHSNRINYNVKLEFVVKVPNNVNLSVSTVNNGNIDVQNVYGTLKANNVNGPVNIVNARGATSARTVNGPLTVNYLSVPPDASSYYTINGTVTITYPANLSADMQFKSMNGAFYTDFSQVEALPAAVTKTEDKKASGTIYKLNKNVQVRVGKGGKLFKFETLNGNIYIKKQS